MLIVGLSGTVASGKNLVAQQFEELGARIFDSDKEVHKIFEVNKDVKKKIKLEFPQALDGDRIDRVELGKLVFGNVKNLQTLEDIVHPVVKIQREEFIKKSRSQKNKLLILNIPLLFEKDIHLSCDASILVITPKLIQKQRFLNRAKEDNRSFKEDLFVAKFEDILQNQLSNHYKRKLADFVINNGQSKANTFKQVKGIFNQLF
jgi:dephospho-CoA kinase